METIRVENLKLSKRSVNGLLRNGIETMDQLLELDEKHLYTLSSLGKKSVSELMNMIELYQYDPSLFMESFMIRDLKSPASKKSMSVLNDIFPETQTAISYDLFFINSHHMYVTDLPLNECKMNARIKTALVCHGYTSLSQVIHEKKNQLYSLHGVGNKSFESLKNTLRGCAVVKILSPAQLRNRKRLNYLLSKKDHPYYLDWLYPLLDDLKEDDFRYTLTLQTQIVNHPDYFSLLKSSIYILLFQNELAINEVKIKKQYPDFISNHPSFIKALKSLCTDGLIYHSNGSYSVCRISMGQWLDGLGQSRRQILLMRLNGYTLENIALATGLTREGVRQIVKREVASRPFLTIDAWASLYERYDLSDEALKEIFGMDNTEIELFKLSYSKGNRPIGSLYEEENLDYDCRSRAWNYCMKKKIQIGSVFVDKDCASIVRELARTHFGQDTAKNQALFDLYQSLMEEYEISDEHLLFDNIRAFEARLERFDFFLNKLGHRFRYYPMDEYDVCALVKNLDLEKYKNQEISAFKLFSENSLLMRENHLQDEYELHNLLKKSYHKWKDMFDFHVHFGRMPILSFGKADRSAQVQELLFRLAPISIDDLALAYEQKYGMKALSVKGNAFGCIRLYYNHGMYNIDFKDPGEEEFEKLKGLLYKDFYSIKEIEDLYKKEFDTQDCSVINPKTLRNLGFIVLSDYVIASKYGSAENYFRTLIQKQEIIDCASLDKNLTSLSSFGNLISTMSGNLDILEIEPRKFITLQAFQRYYAPINKKDILNYVQSVQNFENDGDYFTLYSLKKQGFSHPFFDLPFDEWFASSLLKNTGTMRFSKFGSNILFSRKPKDFTRLDFFTDLLAKYQKIDVPTFCDLLESQYNIYQSRAKILSVLKSSSCTLYYDALSDTIYFSENLFYSNSKSAAKKETLKNIRK
jgi:hypothetical protein